MNSKVLKALEYHKIIEKLAACAGSSLGRKLCEGLLPMNNLADIRRAQKETSEAETRIFRKGSLSLGGVKDVDPSLKRLEVGAAIGMAELLRIASLLECASRAKAYARKDTSDEARDSLDDLFDSLTPLTPVSAEIRRCIISEEELSDDASSTLKHIRRSMRITGDKIHSQMTSMLNGSVRTYLQDAVITMRNNRYCLPVKAEYKNQVPGMIHDQSSSGSTLFIEPMAVVKLNNDLKELSLKEQEEIEVILSRLSEETAAYTGEIRTNLKILVELDFIFAKASLSIEQKASEPIFNEEGRVHIRQARHPLLAGAHVVPIDLKLGEDFDLLIVTGPNTGGKTVSLKTMGLLTLMGQAGLHIPALERSELSLFHEVYADIGDEQSIEQSLSTFSSHMTTIVHILANADERSLVLFDELGAGTDPTEGAALAVAILSHLHGRGIRTMATTHYSELKVYALSTPGVENACCEFDVETLRPTYRLLIGIPGKSNAFAISKKLGLPDYIIDDAKTHIGKSEESFEDLLSDLEASRVTIEKEQLTIAAYKEEISTLKEKLEQKQERLEKQRENLLREAREKADLILREAKEYADQTMKDFRRFGLEGIDTKKMEQKRDELRGKINETQQGMILKPDKTTSKKHKPSDFKVGDAVLVLSLNLKGTVSTLPNAKGDLYVQMGILRSQVNINDLELIDEPVITGPNLKRTGAGKIKMSKSASVGTEINLIGKTTAEAIPELDKYLDDAYLAHLPSVRIVHGKGTGALRNAVHAHLKKLKIVDSYRLGAFGEGEAGVTIVEFKK